MDGGGTANRYRSAPAPKAEALFNTWVARFGAPTIITTDRGTQFDSQLFNALTKMIGSKTRRTTAYHPQSNGTIEQWHRSLKTAIKCHETAEWTKALPVVLLGLRNAVKEDIKTSAAELIRDTITNNRRIFRPRGTFSGPVPLP